MIDALFVIATLAYAFLRLTREIRELRLILAATFVGVVSHSISVLILFTQSPSYEYVVYPSPASAAGLYGSGTVDTLDGKPAASLGRVVGRALHERELTIGTSRPFLRRLPADSRQFWEAVDSYDLEEATGGLALFPRKPIYKGYLPQLYQQISVPWDAPLRIISIHGTPTGSIGSLLAPVNAVPESGVISLRFMAPGPDGGTDTFYYSPLAFEPQESAEARRAADLAQVQLGFSGVTVLTRTPRGRRSWELQAVADVPVYGPISLSGAFLKHPDIRSSQFLESELMAWPRLALLPQIYESAALTWIAGLPAPFLRQVIGLSRLPALAANFAMIPKQYYLLDDSFGAAALFFKIASLCASLALASLVWLCIPKAGGRITRWRAMPVLLITLLLQLSDLFVIRLF